MSSESNSTTSIFIEPGEEALTRVDIHEFASKENPDGDNVFDGRNVSIGIDNPAVHLDISLPPAVLVELINKSQPVLRRLATQAERKNWEENSAQQVG